MVFEIKYGAKTVSVEIPLVHMGTVIKAAPLPQEGGEEEIITNALNNPVDSPGMAKIFQPGDKVVIVTSDITRPMPSYKVLPFILANLNAAGIPDSDITIVFGLGSHRKHREEEKIRLVGEDVFQRIRCLDSDPEDLVSLGKTSRGTPVDLFRPVVEADKRICLGNIEYHYFAGYSGGYKALMPGVSTFDAIQKNHSNMVSEAARAGAMAGNPVREDIDEVANFLKIDFLFNVVLDEQKHVVGAFAGDAISAHRRGCDFLDTLYGFNLDERADIVLVSPGGYPKDLNLYQAQKALDNAKYAVKDGGIIILVAECTEGLGGGIL